jgi:voltage-gated potassium channel
LIYTRGMPARRGLPLNPRTAMIFVRLLFPIALFAAFLLLCVAVYVRLEHLRWVDALFWTMHPHAIEVAHVSDATKIFAMVVYLGIFAFQVWFAERILLTFFSHRGREAWKGIMNDMKLELVEGHFIVCGYGQVGRTVVESLKRDDIPYVLLETDESLAQQALKEGSLVLQGDAKRHSVLESAGIKRAKGICIVIDNDADNLYITITAKSLNPKLKIITRAGHERYRKAMLDAGATQVVIPEAVAGKLLGRLIHRQDAPAKLPAR